MSNYAIYFSPTKGTETITKLFASEFGTYKEIDLCRNDLKETEAFQEEDVCIIGVPSYGGRVPAIALERMKNFHGHSAKTILVVVYGNRAYDDTLAELQDFLTERNFCIIAAVAAVAEHSVIRQFAKNRPDEKDKDELLQYARKIKKALHKNPACSELSLPGNRPYKAYNGIPLKPKATKKCSKCGICAASCPVGAIPSHAPNTTDTDVCISCMRCIRVCPTSSRKLDPLLLKMAALKMRKVCAARKENELFMGRSE